MYLQYHTQSWPGVPGPGLGVNMLQSQDVFGLSESTLNPYDQVLNFTKKKELPPIICFSAKMHDRRSLQSKPDDHPKPLLHSVHHHSYSSNSTPLHSGRSSPAPSDNTLTAGRGGYTGNSTERSIYSLGSASSLDDIDRQASSKVTENFDYILSVLFKDQNEDDWSRSKSSPVTKGTQFNTQRECQEWASQFPHIRILGSQIEDPGLQLYQTKELGFQCIEREDSPTSMHLDIYDVHDHDNNDNIDSHVANFDELIRGNGILPKHPPTEATAFTNMDADTDNGFEFLREEIFAQDGLYEEIIAIDRAEDNVEPKVMMLPPSRRVGYPPITPNACITNSVMSRLFDDLWKNVIEWMWPVIQKEYPFVTDDVMQQNLDANPSSPNHNNQSPASRQPSFIVNKPILGGRAVTHVGSMFDSQKSFEGILQISSMPMYARDSLDSAAIVDKRPGSSIVTRQQRPMSRNFSNPRSMVKRNQQLPPLYSGDRTKEEESSMDALHVHVRKLVPHNTGESISPPPSSAMYQRNNALPPLHMEKSKTYYNRASSAIHVDNKDGRNNFYTNRANLHVERPSTTNEMRSDNLSIANLRRSSTPLGQNRSHLIGNKMFINGSGLQPSSDYPHLQPDILEDHEGSIEEGIQHNNHWPTSNISNNNRIRRQRPRYLVDAK